MVAVGPPAFWLRCEKKEFERRSALTPTTAKKLIDAGFDIFVERDEQRIFDDEEFARFAHYYSAFRILMASSCRVGCTMVPNNAWPNAPVDVPILGLKELELSIDPLPHTHIQFAHCYKKQAGWAAVLSRFRRGGGKLYDLEFLTNERGRRIAAFGFHAGFAGAACGVLAYAAQKKGKKLGLLKPFDNEDAMVRAVREAVGDDIKSLKAMVTGSMGRCGTGAIDLFRKVGLPEYVYSTH